MRELAPPSLASVSLEAPYAGHRELSIERLGHITLVVGPKGSGKSQMLAAVEDSACQRDLFRMLGIPPTVCRDSPTELLIFLCALRDDLSALGEPGTQLQRMVTVTDLAKSMGIEAPIWSGDLGHLNRNDQMALVFAMSVAKTPPRTASFYDGLDHVAVGERWPMLWSFVLEQIAGRDGAQIVSATRDYDVAGALALAKRAFPAVEVTLIGLDGHEPMADHSVLGEFHDWDTSTVREIAEATRG